MTFLSMTAGADETLRVLVRDSDGEPLSLGALDDLELRFAARVLPSDDAPAIAKTLSAGGIELGDDTGEILVHLLEADTAARATQTLHWGIALDLPDDYRPDVDSGRLEILVDLSRPAPPSEP